MDQNDFPDYRARDDKYLFCRNRACEMVGVMTVAYCFDAKEVEPEIL